jgi:signal transduction histidine kinase
MKLARKLILSTILGLIVVLSTNAYYRVQREIAAFDLEMRKDHEVLARVLERAVSELWSSQGRQAALTFIGTMQSPNQTPHIRWLGEPSAPAPMSTSSVIVSRFPVHVDGQIVGVIELSETRDFAAAYVRKTIVRSILLTFVAVLTVAALATILGLEFVGRPIDKLVAQVARIGDGDVETRVTLRQHDELGEMAAAINAMCARLEDTRHALAAATEERWRAQDQLRHADRLATVGKLASGVAHELGTPLGVALMRANLLATNAALPREAREGARIIGEQIDRITHIVRQLLDFARGRGSTPPGPQAQRHPADLSAIAQKAVAMLQPLAVKRRLVLEIVSDGIVPSPPANPEQIGQVLVNLLVNAIHASERPGKVTVRIGTTGAKPPADLTPPVGGPGDEPRYAFLSVTDEGIGIAPDILPRIFEPFFTTKHVGEGTGLGLSVAYGIVREHSGWIEVTSEPNKGSCFQVFLPMELPDVQWST